MTEHSVSKARGVRPRTLLFGIAAILLVAAAVVAIVLLTPRGGVELVGFSAESTATVAYAGRFPADDEPRLLNPLGIAVRGTTLYVAESDAGRIRIFGLRGEDRGSIVVPIRQGAPTAYPSDVATLGADRIVVVDNSGARVLVMSADPKAKTPLVAVLGDADGSNTPIQPTAVAVDGETIFVADSGDSTVKAYGADGAYSRTVVKGSGDASTFAGGLFVASGKIYATNSNTGRVLAFDIDSGTLATTFPDTFALPRGLGSGLGGGLLVADTFERTVRLTDQSGHRIDVIDGNTTDDGELGSPRDSAWVPSTSRAYVTDAQSGRVVVFNMREVD